MADFHKTNINVKVSILVEQVNTKLIRCLLEENNNIIFIDQNWIQKYLRKPSPDGLTFDKILLNF